MRVKTPSDVVFLETYAINSVVTINLFTALYLEYKIPWKGSTIALTAVIAGLVSGGSATS